MRALTTAFLLAAAAAQAAPSSPTIDLDRPGALEQLEREQPAHYAKVISAMSEVQAVPFAKQAQHNLRLEFDKPDPTRRSIETSDPAKTRLTVPVDDVQYRITVHYTKDPAALSRAK